MTTRRIRVVATADGRYSHVFEFDVPVTIGENPGLDNIEQQVRVGALRMLADRYETRIGSRFPLPRDNLVVAFEAPWSEQVPGATT